MKNNSVWWLSALAVIWTVSGGLAQETGTTQLPTTWFNQADAIIRNSEQVFTIKAIDAATLHVEQTVTILNGRGDRYARMAILYHEQTTSIKNVQYYVLNEDGTVKLKVKGKDIQDISHAQGSLYEDSRVKWYQHNSYQYPYTISYAYDIVYDGLLHYPSWYPQAGYQIAVEKASFAVVTPESLVFRHKSSHSLSPPTVLKEGRAKVYSWEVAHLPALQAEPFGPSFSMLTPVVWTAPNDFAYEGYSGNMKTWQAFGQWNAALSHGRRELPAETIRHIKKLTADTDDPYLIIKKLYEYMQSKTRYVSIQLGIGGYQPFDATTVDQLGYGDCKALSNYMIALLDVVNIPAYYTLVRAGEEAAPILTDFPSTQFNHAIVCVPVQQDTVWLECTSQTMPAGFLGSFTSNRHVLIIDEQGGHIAKTPTYAPASNLQSRTASVILDEQGHGDASITTLYTGLQYEHIEGIARESPTEQRKQIYQKTSIASFDLVDFHYELLKKQLPVAKETIDLQLRHYANVSGKRLFFNPNLLNRIDFALPVLARRNTDIFIHNAYLDVDSITFHLPAHMQLEHLPKAVSILSKFGEYEAQYHLHDNKVLYIRRLKILPGHYRAEDYESLRLFYEQVSKVDHASVVVKAT